MDTSKIISLLGDKSDYYLNHVCKTIDKSLLHLPSPTCVDDVWGNSDRNIQTLNSLQTLLGHGRLANTGYVSILPVDQDIEHTAGSSFAPNPIYFDPENIVKLAIEGGCNAVASTFGILGSVARKYAHKIPFLVKLNHNELLTYPNSYNQILFGTVKEAWNMGAIAVGATIYFGSEQSRRQIIERYNEGLRGCDVQVLDHFGDDHSSSGHLYLVRLLGEDVEYRNAVIERMAERGIACNVHYKPLPMMTAYKNLGFDIVDYPNAYNQYHNEITLPLHTSLTNEDVEYVISNFVDIITQ